jgi:hypothetical protein
LSKYRFKPSERYAVFTVHGEICYLCRKPVDMATFQVDHIIPESLESKKETLEKALDSYGLDGSFNLNSFENWMPACAPCNNEKRETVFKALPIFAVQLDKAARKAEQARQLEKDVGTSRQIAKAVGTLEAAHQKGKLGGISLVRLLPLLEYLQPRREPENLGKPLRVSPVLEVLRRNGAFVTVKGPYGVGTGTDNAPNHGGFRCGSCGASAWNGARCVVCGAQDDD